MQQLPSQRKRHMLTCYTLAMTSGRDYYAHVARVTGPTNRKWSIFGLLALKAPQAVNNNRPSLWPSRVVW